MTLEEFSERYEAFVRAHCAATIKLIGEAVEAGLKPHQVLALAAAINVKLEAENK